MSDDVEQTSGRVTRRDEANQVDKLNELKRVIYDEDDVDDLLLQWRRCNRLVVVAVIVLRYSNGRRQRWENNGESHVSCRLNS